MRTVESEKEFSDGLLEVGDERSGTTISLPPFWFSNTQDSVEQLYGDINFNTVTAQHLRDRAMLSVTNVDS
jgi:hypothetical protein